MIALTIRVSIGSSGSKTSRPAVQIFERLFLWIQSFMLLALGAGLLLAFHKDQHPTANPITLFR